MFRYLLILVTASVVAYAQSNNRIVGGTPTRIQLFPFQVSLRNANLTHICGGSIFRRNIILTAANCVNDFLPDNLFVVAGSTTLSPISVIRSVSDIIVHPGYNSTTFDNDIAVLVLSESLSWSSTVRPIRLAITTPLVRSNASITGWGSTSENGTTSDRLLVAYVPIVSRRICAINYAPLEVTVNMICAGFTEGGTDACHRDTGGPLVVRGALAGITSWGEGCGRPNRPRVYTSVPRFYSWIIANSIGVSKDDNISININI